MKTCNCEENQACFKCTCPDVIGSQERYVTTAELLDKSEYEIEAYNEIADAADVQRKMNIVNDGTSDRRVVELMHGKEWR